MDEEPKRDHQLLRRLRPKLIEILSADPDFILQHAHSLQLVSDNGYKRVKPQQISTEKVTALLDHVYDRGPGASHGLLKLLKDDVCQENFPMLSFLKSPDVGLPLSTEETSERSEEESVPKTQQCQRGGPTLVTEKQLMMVAGGIAHNWKEVGILVLDISSQKLDEIEADNPKQKMRAFRMMHSWRCCQKEKATAAKLYSLLSQEDLAIAPESLECLQESS